MCATVSIQRLALTLLSRLSPVNRLRSGRVSKVPLASGRDYDMFTLASLSTRSLEGVTRRRIALVRLPITTKTPVMCLSYFV